MPAPKFRSLRPRRLQTEQLEPRMMMSGDGIGLSLAAAADDAAAAQSAAASATTASTHFTSMADLRAWITQEATEKYGHLFGQEQPRYYSWCCDIDVSFTRPIAMVSSDQALNLTADNIDFDSTNVQVAGVDEADLIESDGDYLYVLSGNELIVVDARVPDDLSIASRVILDSTPTGMYLSGDRLTLVSETDPENDSQFGFVMGRSWYNPNQTTEANVTVTVLDLSDRTVPTQVEQTELDGRLVSSRMVDGQLQLVVEQRSDGFLPQPLSKRVNTVDEQTTNSTGANLVSLDVWYGGSTTYRYETIEEYVDRAVAALAPGYRTLSVAGEVLEQWQFIDPTEIRRPDAPSEPQMQQSLIGYHPYQPSNYRTTVATFNVTDSKVGPDDFHVLESADGAQVYATADGLYLFGRSTDPNDQVIDRYATDIWKFEFDSNSHEVSLVGKGQVAGSLLNQFAADEHNGFLRVVTAEGGWSGAHRLTVLQLVGDTLVTVGEVGGMAPGEELHSVRFDGDRGYVVTFRKVDPLFALDLSNPTNPTIEGELKIPGFSDYLHPIGEDHLLGIGRGADETRGLFEEMQVSIFDVSELEDPQLAHRHSIGGGRSTASIVNGDRWAEGDGDHHAASYFAEEGIFALPIFNADGGWGWSPDDALFDPGEGGLLVLSIDVNAGISELALIEHNDPIHRSLKIGDALVAISSGTITTHDFDAPASEMSRLDLAIGSDSGLVELTQYVPMGAFVLTPSGNVSSPIGGKQIANRSVIQGGVQDAAILLALGLSDVDDRQSADLVSDNSQRERESDAETTLEVVFGAEELVPAVADFS